MNDEIAGVDTLALPPLTRPVLQLLLLLSSIFYHSFFQGTVNFFDFFIYFMQHCFTAFCRPSVSTTMSEDAGIEKEEKSK
jgi:hypothetical protein